MTDDALDFIGSVGTEVPERKCWVRDCERPATPGRIVIHWAEGEQIIWLCYGHGREFTLAIFTTPCGFADFMDRLKNPNG